MKNPTAMLSVGAGQDSTALIYKFCLDSDFRQSQIGNADLIAVMADTGNEYPDTYIQVEYLKAFCKKYHLPFYFLTPDMGFHGNTWHSLQAQMHKNHNIMSVALPKTCTDNLKIKVCDRFMEKYIKEKYNYTQNGKRVFYQYFEDFGKMTYIIGFAKGEEKRQILPKNSQLELFPKIVKDKRPIWKQKNITTQYPLIDIGWSRQDCQNYINNLDLRLPMPSNCMFCPFQNEPEIVYLYRNFPEKFEEWKLYEAKKLQKNKEQPRNLGAKGEQTLQEYLNAALGKYGHWTLEQLHEYKNSHGHCVKSKY